MLIFGACRATSFEDLDFFEVIFEICFEVIIIIVIIKTVLYFRSQFQLKILVILIIQ